MEIIRQTEWRTDVKPGYRSKTLYLTDNVTVVVHRPILDEKERAKRERVVEHALTAYARSLAQREAASSFN